MDVSNNWFQNLFLPVWSDWQNLENFLCPLRPLLPPGTWGRPEMEWGKGSNVPIRLNAELPKETKNLTQSLRCKSSFFHFIFISSFRFDRINICNRVWWTVDFGTFPPFVAFLGSAKAFRSLGDTNRIHSIESIDEWMTISCPSCLLS